MLLSLNLIIFALTAAVAEGVPVAAPRPNSEAACEVTGASVQAARATVDTRLRIDMGTLRVEICWRVPLQLKHRRALGYTHPIAIRSCFFSTSFCKVSVNILSASGNDQQCSDMHTFVPGVNIQSA